MAEGATAYVNGEKITGNIFCVQSDNYMAMEANQVMNNAGNSGVLLRAYTEGQFLKRSGGGVGLIAPYSSFGNATAADVSYGKTFTSSAGLKVTGTGGIETLTFCTSITEVMKDGMPYLKFYIPDIKTTNTIINFATFINYTYQGSKEYGLVGGIYRENSTLSPQLYTMICGSPGTSNGFDGGALATIDIFEDGYVYVNSSFVLHGGNVNSLSLSNIKYQYFEISYI